MEVTTRFDVIRIERIIDRQTSVVTQLPLRRIRGLALRATPFATLRRNLLRRFAHGNRYAPLSFPVGCRPQGKQRMRRWLEMGI